MPDWKTRLVNRLLAQPELPPPPVAKGAPPVIDPSISADDLVRIARQSRPLTDNESDIVRRKFGGALDPSMLRSGFDPSISGTNLAGYTSTKLPATVWMGDEPVNDIPTFNHELTHSWQGETGGRYTSNDIEHQLHIGNGPFEQSELMKMAPTSLGPEEQATINETNPDSAVGRLISSHPAPSGPRSDTAFIDSIRESRPSLLNKVKGGINEVEWKNGKGRMKGAF